MAFTRGTNPAFASNTAAGLTLATAAYNQAANGWIWVAASWTAADTSPSITDTAGNAYIPLRVGRDTTNAQFTALFYVPKSIGNAANVVTCNFGLATAAFRGLRVLQYSYQGRAALLEAPAPVFSGASNTAASTGPFQAGQCGICLVSEFISTTTTPGSGWTEQTDDAPTGFHLADRIDNPGGTIVGDMTLAASSFWVAAAASAIDGLPEFGAQVPQAQLDTRAHNFQSLLNPSGWF